MKTILILSLMLAAGTSLAQETNCQPPPPPPTQVYCSAEVLADTMKKISNIDYYRPQNPTLDSFLTFLREENRKLNGQDQKLSLDVRTITLENRKLKLKLKNLNSNASAKMVLICTYHSYPKGIGSNATYKATYGVGTTWDTATADANNKVKAKLNSYLGPCRKISIEEIL